MDLTKPKGIKNPAKGVVWVDLTKTIVRKKNPAKGGIWVDLTKDKKICYGGIMGGPKSLTRKNKKVDHTQYT